MTNIDFQMILLIIFIFVCFFFLMTKANDFYISKLFNYKKDLKVSKKSELLPSKQKNNSSDIYIGINGKRKVYLPANSKHVFVVGTTGSGKTVALSNFIKTATENSYGLLLIDGKGDINNDSLLDIVKKLKNERKLYIIDLNNPTCCDKYNPFKNTSVTVIKDMLISMSDWSEEHYKINAERYLQCVIDLLFKANQKIDFKTIIRYMEVDNFLYLSKELVQKNIITKEQDLKNKEISKTSGKVVENSIARFSTLLESDIAEIFSGDGIDCYTALQENAVIIFILNPLSYPIISQNFGKLIIIDSKKAVSKLYKLPTKKRSFFIYDEINVYASKILLDLVNKSRSADVSCILSSQSLSDLVSAVDDSFKEQVIENCNNYIIMRQNSSVNAETLANVVGTRKTIDVTYQLGENGATGKGSARRTYEFILHPDEIKNFNTGEAFVVSKDMNYKCKVKINYPL